MDEAQSTGRPTLIFDGECGFCTSVVLWLEARFDEAVDCVAWQAADLARYGVAPEEARRAVWWVESDGKRCSAEAAAASALAACRPPWSWLGRFLRWPGVRTLARHVYHWVARNRGRLPGTVPACDRSAETPAGTAGPEPSTGLEPSTREGR